MYDQAQRILTEQSLFIHVIAKIAASNILGTLAACLSLAPTAQAALPLGHQAGRQAVPWPTRNRAAA